MSHPAAYSRKQTRHAPAPFSLASSTARRSVVRCRAVSCPASGAVPCRALQSFLFRAHQTTTLLIASMQSWPEPACMSSSILYSCCLYFPLFLGLQQTSSGGTYAATNNRTAVCTSMYVVEPRAQQSTAEHSAIPLHKAANQIRAD